MNSLVEICYRFMLEKEKDISLFCNIEPPQKDENSGDYICRVTSSADLGFRIDVYGIIPQQAVKLALELVTAKINNILSDHITENWTDKGTATA